MDLLKDINKTHDTTVLVVTHREKLSSYATMVVKMDRGQIVSKK